MSRIMKTDPYRDLERFDPFREFGGFAGWPRLSRWLTDTTVEPTIKLDVSEDDKGYMVKADLPGVKKEDIKVVIDGNQVSLSAEVKRESEEKKGETIHTERYYGRQFRSFTLGRNVDRTKAEAKFKDGVLELTLPKNGTEPSKPLAIQ